MITGEAHVLRCRVVDHPDLSAGARCIAADPYLERCWTHLVGPTGVALAGAVAWLVQDRPELALRAGDLAATVGIGRAGRTATIWRAAGRLHRFRIAAVSDARLDIFRQVPLLSPLHLARAPEAVRRAHDDLIAAQLVTPGPSD